MSSSHSVRTLLGSLVVAAGLYACGGPAPAASPAEGTADAGVAAPAAAADASAESATAADAGTPAVTATEAPKFDDLPKEKKVEVMATKVVPNVGKEFKEFDAKHFAKFGCATCHGPQKKDDPHNVLPKLTFSNGGFEKLSKKHPEMMKFMAEKVVPSMATALGEKPFDPATKQGFGCGGCHSIN